MRSHELTILYVVINLSVLSTPGEEEEEKVEEDCRTKTYTRARCVRVARVRSAFNESMAG